MFFYRLFCAGVCACLMFPAWAEIAPEYSQAPSSSSNYSARDASPSLQVFILQILKESAAVQQAQAAIDAATARADGAGKPLHNPTLELDAERTDTNTATVGISQTIDWSNKQGAISKIAALELQETKANLLEVRQSIAVETLDALARYYTVSEMRVLALRRSQLMKEFIDAVKQRHRAGDIGALDVSLAQVAYSDALMAQATSESGLAEAEAALKAVSGLDLTQWPQMPTKLVPPPESADPSLLESLPELAVLRSRIQAAKARINLAERKGRVDPTIGVRAGREGTGNLVGITLEIPLFARNNYQTEIQAASYDVIIEERAYRNAYQRAYAHLEGSLGRYINTSRAWHAWITTGKQAHADQMSLLNSMWQAGELDAADFLIQAKQNIDTQIAATTLLGEAWQSAIAWLKASGQVSQWLGISNDFSKVNLGVQP